MGIDDRTVATSVGLRDALNAYAPEDRSTSRVLREEDACEMSATLADLRLPPTCSQPNTDKRPGKPRRGTFRAWRVRETVDRPFGFLNRPLEGEWPYLWLDATYIKVRRSGRIVSVAAIVAVAVNTDGRLEVLGIAIQPSEAEVFWDKFLRALADRGLRGVKLIIADVNRTLRRLRELDLVSIREGRVEGDFRCARHEWPLSDRNLLPEPIGHKRSFLSMTETAEFCPRLPMEKAHQRHSCKPQHGKFLRSCRNVVDPHRTFVLCAANDRKEPANVDVVDSRTPKHLT